MPKAARVTDRGVTHCSGFTIAAGSPDVNINNLAAARVGDPSTAHLSPCRKKCCIHVSRISTGSDSVLINGKKAARVGDLFGGCTRVATGSPDVVIG